MVSGPLCTRIGGHGCGARGESGGRGCRTMSLVDELKTSYVLSQRKLVRKAPTNCPREADDVR